MSLELVFAAGAAGTTALAWLAHRERQTIRGRRRLILDPVVALFDDPHVTTDGAGIPKLEGHYRALDLKLAFLRTASAVDTTCTKTRKLDFFYAKPPGFAPQADAKSADALFTEGKSLMQAGHFSEACPKLEASAVIQP